MLDFDGGFLPFAYGGFYAARSAQRITVPPAALNPGDQCYVVFVTTILTTVSSSTSVPRPSGIEFGSAVVAERIINFQAVVAGVNLGWSALDVNWKAQIFDGLACFETVANRTAP